MGEIRTPESKAAFRIRRTDPWSAIAPQRRILTESAASGETTDCAACTGLRNTPITFNSNVNDVAGDQRPTPAGVPVAITSPGSASSCAKSSAPERPDGINHQRSSARLAAACPFTCFDQQVVWFQLRFDVRPDGAKSVEAFRARELHIALLQIARGHIVHAGVSEHVGQRVARRPQMGASACRSPSQLAFMFDALRIFRKHDWLIGARRSTTDGFRKISGSFGTSLPSSAACAAVVASNAYNLSRLDGSHEAYR